MECLLGNSGISLVDVGDGIGCFELHSKMNALGEDIVSFLLKSLRAGSRRGEELRWVCDLYGRAELFCGREPDAAAAGSAGWRVG